MRASWRLIPIVLAGVIGLACHATARGGAGNSAAPAVAPREEEAPAWVQRGLPGPGHAVTLIVHSENALAPALARKFAAELRVPSEEAWLKSAGQIDFHDDPMMIDQATDHIAKFFENAMAVRA